MKQDVRDDRLAVCHSRVQGKRHGATRYVRAIGSYLEVVLEVSRDIWWHDVAQGARLDDLLTRQGNEGEKRRGLKSSSGIFIKFSSVSI